MCWVVAHGLAQATNARGELVADETIQAMVRSGGARVLVPLRLWFGVADILVVGVRARSLTND